MYFNPCRYIKLYSYKGNSRFFPAPESASIIVAVRTRWRIRQPVFLFIWRRGKFDFFLYIFFSYLCASTNVVWMGRISNRFYEWVCVKHFFNRGVIEKDIKRALLKSVIRWIACKCLWCVMYMWFWYQKYRI